MLHLTGRYYRTIPHHQAGYVEETIELAKEKTALVVMHCWNIGCADGPAVDPNYWVGMGFQETIQEAERIMRERIRPAMEAARAAKVLVCHVENHVIASRHPEALRDADCEEAAAKPPSSPAITTWRAEMGNRCHGERYDTDSPYAKMDRAAIVAPLPGEPFVFQTAQFHRALSRHGIENLIYTGFAADMCVLRAPGGIEPMAGFGYRLFLMRDATLGVEFPDTLSDRIATRWAVRYFETHYGDTVLCDDFIQACARAREGDAR